MQISREYIERLVGHGKTRRGGGSTTEISGGGISEETLANEISNLKAWVKNLTWWGQKFPSGSDVITLRPNSPHGIRIGDAYIVWDSTKKALKVTGNPDSDTADDARMSIYATGSVSALGLSDSSGGGGGGGIDFDAMWQALGTDSVNQQIAASHLTTALSGYATQTWVTQNFVKQVKINGTTYSPTNGLVDLGNVGGAAGSVIHKEVGANDLTAESGSFFFGGSGTLKTGYDYVGFQAGNSQDKWQVVAIDNLIWRQNDNGGTDAAGWSAWRTILDTSNWSSTINLTSLGAASASALSTIQGYFTNGVANTAAKLNTGATTYSVWGQTYWQNGVPKTVVGDIRLMPSGGNTNSDSAKIDFRTLAGDSYIYAPYIQAVNVDSYGKKRLSVFQKNQSDWTTAQVEVFTILPSGFVGIGTTSPAHTLDVNGNAHTSGYVQIGSIRMSYDADNNAIKVNGNIYATGAVSALGVNTSGGGGGGGIDIDAMWQALGTDSLTQQISATHLTTALSGYATQSWVTSQNYVKQVRINGTTYSPTNGLVDLGSQSGLEGYLPLTAGSSKALTGSLYLSSRGKGIFMPYTVSGSTTNIPLIYDNGENLWIGSTQTTTNHHIGQTYISAGHNGTAGNDTIYVCVPNANNNGGTNYAVLHAGNSSVSKSGETLTVKINGTQQSLTNTWRGIQNNLSSESTTESLSAKQGKVLYEYAEMLQGYIVTLQGYFTNGVAKTAAKLNTGTTTYTAWGQTYWQNGVPQSVSGSAYFQKGNMLYWKLNDYNSQSTATYSDVLCLGVNSSGLFVGFGSAGLGYPSYFDGGTISLRTGTSRSNAMFINASGNVGIGTTSPSYKLHVAGTGYYSDTLRVQGIEIGQSNEIYSINDYDLYIQHRNAGNLILCTNGRNVGIGTSSPSYTLDVSGNAHTSGYVQIGSIRMSYDSTYNAIKVEGNIYATGAVSALGADDSTSGATTTKVLENYYSSRPTTANVKFGDGGLRTFMATSSMNVTTGKPPYDAAIIHCAWDNTGGWEAQLALGNSSAGVFYRSQNSGTWDFWRTLYDNYSELKPAVDGQYSIGHATGNFASGTDYVGFASLFLSDGSERGWMYVDSDGLTINSTGTIYLGNTVLQTMECSGTGYSRSLGVGGSNSSYTLYVSGTTNLNGNVYVKGTLTHSSDMRLKDIEEQRQLSVGDIAAAPLFAFRWKDRSVDGSLHVGTSAQYWQQIVREVVASDAEGMLSIDYGVAAMAGVISIARKTVTLEEKIKRLEKENETLRQEIERLKAA